MRPFNHLIDQHHSYADRSRSAAIYTARPHADPLVVAREAQSSPCSRTPCCWVQHHREAQGFLYSSVTAQGGAVVFAQAAAAPILGEAPRLDTMRSGAAAAAAAAIAALPSEDIAASAPVEDTLVLLFLVVSCPLLHMNHQSTVTPQYEHMVRSPKRHPVVEIST